MKTLITKADGTPTKSKVRALQYLESKGISKDCLIEENGQFFYEEGNSPKAEIPVVEEAKNIVHCAVTWDTPVFNQNNEKTQLFIPGTDVVAYINGKHPAGQLRNKSSFEINIGDENFVMSVDLISKIFKVWG